MIAPLVLIAAMFASVALACFCALRQLDDDAVIMLVVAVLCACAAIAL